MKDSSICELRTGHSFMKVFIRPLPVLLLLAPLLSCAAGPRFSTDDFREKILDAYGGRARLSQIQSVAAEGTINAIVRQDSGTYRRAWRRDGKLFVDVNMSKSHEIRVLNGTRALRSVDGKMEDVSGPKALAMIYQYNELSMPFALLDNSIQLEDRGRDALGGMAVRMLRFVDRAGNSMDMAVNEASYRILKTTGTFSLGGQATTLSAEFGNFKFFDGVLVPFTIVNYAGGTRISVTTISDYLFNGALSDSMFDPHAGTQK